MRFLLVARARSTGAIRPLSERAFESQAAAVDAAAVTAAGLDLADDEVLALDLDAAGPVLVLRVGSVPVVIPVAEPVPDVSPASPLGMASGVVSDAGPFGLDLRPSEPEGGASDERLSETLARVAERMQQDLSASLVDDRSGAEPYWDARTFDDYALPCDGELSEAREEGRVRMAAAELSEAVDYAIGNRSHDEPDDSAHASGFWEDHAPDVPDDRALAWEPPPEPYRPTATDFSMWVCADCVYQRTCRKAGIATPSTCGNFQWGAR